MDLDSLYIYILYYFRSCLIRGVAYRILFRTEGLNGLCPSRICCATPNPIFILFSLNYVVLLQHSGSIHKKICFFTVYKSEEKLDRHSPTDPRRSIYRISHTSGADKSMGACWCEAE